MALGRPLGVFKGVGQLAGKFEDKLLSSCSDIV